MTKKIILKDDHKIFDCLASQKNPFAKGWVRVYLDKKFKNQYPDFEGSNLITGYGREFSAQRLFNTNTGSTNDYRSYVISGFGIGGGGASISNSQPVLTNTTLDDNGLFSPIPINDSYDTEQSSSTNGVIKPISTDGSIELVSGGYGTLTYYSKVKCTCVIKDGEPTSLAAGESVQISEAGLYAKSQSNNILFSHICFPPKWKESESNITIEWYIIC